MAEQSVNDCDNNVRAAIFDIETLLGGKHAAEVKALRSAVKILNLEHKVSEQEKEIRIKDKEIRIKNQEIQILKLENGNKLLKLKYNTDDVQEDTTPSKNEKQVEPMKDSVSQKDVNKFFQHEYR